MTCNHQWSEKTHDGLLSRICHDCNLFEIEVEVEELRAEVERLRAEVEMLRARLVECRPWVGVCPIEPARINEVCLVRDLADDTLAEVKL